MSELSVQATQKATDKPPIAAVPGTVVDGVTFVTGGLGAVRGLRCSGVHAGFRRNPERRDLALIVSEHPVAAAGMFTRNRFCAAPVEVSRAHLAACCGGTGDAGDAGCGVRAVLINSGNANATTGVQGLEVARQSAALAADALGCAPEQVLVASTGVIGVPLGIEGFERGIPAAVAALGPADASSAAADAAGNAACAIMTTDTVPKSAAVTFSATQSDGVQVTYTIAAIAKGSGMIQPDMATMLAVVATDADLTVDACDRALRRAVEVTLNRVTVDSDTSTNDSVFLLATGGMPGRTINPDCPLFEPFVRALTVLLTDLARRIAYDGEGATRLVTVDVTGAVDDGQADRAARSIANSPLIKTAIAGHDANWGRIAMALGKSGARFDVASVDIDLMGVAVCRAGLPVAFDEDAVARLFNERLEIPLQVRLGAGSGSARVWTCDLTHDYVTINADYRT
ncbi:MAG: bifunctional glutamate N-acetyltransferase/amino-acid acetyltransferase ArgJ [Actinomycetes bacterium]|nr:bifunctional glutamate N-acetyltransferase/amino-acid acetyltransferase ArgJ [Actinomycetes bacterium]